MARQKRKGRGHKQPSRKGRDHNQLSQRKRQRRNGRDDKLHQTVTNRERTSESSSNAVLPVWMCLT